MIRKNSRWCMVPVALLAVAILAAGAGLNAPEGDFSSGTIDVGIVVSDVEKAAEFYKNGLGFTELPGFDVPAPMGAAAGLSDSKPFSVRVFVLVEGDTSTKIKLMEFADTSSAKADHSFIHSTLGFSYLTILVKDIQAAVERARKAGAKPLAKGPYRLPEGFPEGIYLAVVRDPDGNLIEFVGPKP